MLSTSTNAVLPTRFYVKTANKTFYFLLKSTNVAADANVSIAVKCQTIISTGQSLLLSSDWSKPLWWAGSQSYQQLQPSFRF